MNYRDHDPPHFHARSGDQEVSIEIDSLMVTGRMASARLRLVLHWAERHRHDLAENWRRASRSEPLTSIPPIESGGMLHVSDVRYLHGFTLRVRFDTGEIKDVDLANELKGEVFLPLRDLEFFKRVYVNPETGTVEWPNGADLAPEFLFDLGGSVESVA